MNQYQQKRQNELERQKRKNALELQQKAARQKRIKIILLAVLCVAVLATGITLAAVFIGRDNRSVATITVRYQDDEGIMHEGDIVVELDRETAPITVKNFVKLADSGFYDGLTWHRVIEGFMIQGGDPKGNGSGGSAQNIKGEFSANGVKNGISHVRGVISMARQGANGTADAQYYDTASSQFFIVHDDSTYLDGKYAAFGHVVSGLEFVDGIAMMETDENDKPRAEATIVSIVISD